MFNFFKKEAEPEKSMDLHEKIDMLANTDIDDIWRLDNKNDMLIALNFWLHNKCNYGEFFEKLSDAERTLFLVQNLDGEVNNGGFDQFYYNSSGKFANETPAAFRKIGAYKVADICERANAVLGGPLPLPSDRAMLQDVLLALTEEECEQLSRYDSEFYAYPDDLTELCYDFAMRRREQFTR